VILFALALFVFIILFIRYERKPVITGLDRLTAAPGDRLEIYGRFFGDVGDNARLLFGSNPLPSTGVIEWSDQRIVAEAPKSDGAVLVRVKNRAGLSKGAILGDATRAPRLDYGHWFPGAPYIENIQPDVGVPGSLITLFGEGFGYQKGGGNIWLNRSDTADILDSEKPDLSKYIAAELIDSWTDQRVSFWVPPGTSSGRLYIQKEDMFSNSVFFEIGDKPGSLETGTPVQWSLRQECIIQQIGSFPGNTLYLHLPAPMAGSGQRRAAVLVSPGNSGATLIRNKKNLAFYRMNELHPGEERVISRQIVMELAPLRTLINPAELLPYDARHPDIAAALKTDQWIRPDLVSQLATQIAGGIRNDWVKSKAIYDYVLGILDYDENPPSRVISDYSSTHSADSQGYSFLFSSLARAASVPSRPVAGLVVLEDGSSRIWWWSELWIQGIGWIPIDPAMGDSSISLQGVEGDVSSFYFGNLEGRHIAFSRGILPSGAFQPKPDLRSPRFPYSLQGVWEEVSGNLMTYTSIWPVPRVTGSYSQE